MSDCFDCRHAAIREWPAFTANCQGCMDRALAGLKTLPPLEPAEGKPAHQLLDEDTSQTGSQVLEAQRQRIAKSEPQLVHNYDTFRQNYAAYERMTQQFQPQSTTAVASAPVSGETSRALAGIKTFPPVEPINVIRPQCSKPPHKDRNL